MVAIMNKDKMTVWHLLPKLPKANTLGVCSPTVTREAARNSEISATTPVGWRCYFSEAQVDG
jgi:hypothetical protein